ncbi:MAG: alkaline phosphatase family protein [Acidobacteria bacterium]|nr:alkaline phosphatase family protein [Acidobacteriota bacterium]
MTTDRVFRSPRTIHLALFLVLGLALSSSCLSGGAASGGTGKKVIVLGFDGMDPRLLQRFMEEGRLPNFSRLSQPGHYRPLTTSVPPQSPVAWSNFITGMDPGGHGIFDFVHRDPATLLPYLSTSEVTEPKHTLRLGSWVIPLSSGRVTLLRDGKAFWQILSERGVPATVYRIPANFPPVPSKARTFSGMGTPDMLGTYGTFSFYTDQPPENSENVSGGKVYPVRVEASKVQAKLVGPPNSLRRGQPRATVDFTVWLDPTEPVAKIEFQEEQILLQQGEWSDWVRVEFELVPYLASVSGICRFYLKQVRPTFQLYVSPVNIDPSEPALPLSTPEDYAPELARRVGFFYTQGIAEDTKALTAGIFDDSEFLRQARLVFEDERKVFDVELARFRDGLFFFYFSSLDQVAHMVWRMMDEKHPGYDPQLAARHATALAELYQEMDRVLGQTLAKVDANTTLIVMSDHGFAPFYRSFNINTWLLENGYLVLLDPQKREGTDLFTNVDWSRSRAYALGLNALYLNLEGRERLGIVSASRKDELLEKISRELLAYRDPANGQPAVTRVYRAEETYHGAHVEQAPDLLIGYNWGYRAGWETSLGGFTRAIVEDNPKEWSGDHCMDHTFVPGVLLSNKEIRLGEPSLVDMAPTILAEFGVEKPSEMQGQSVFAPERRAAGDD